MVRAILVLGVVALFFIVVGQLAQAFFFFGDIFLTFFLAWLLAFIISPIVARLMDLDPRLPRALAAVIVYTLVVAILVVIVVAAAGALATSTSQFVAQIPNIRSNLPTILAPWQEFLTSIGLGQVDLLVQANDALANLDQLAGALVEPLQRVAVASLGAIGTMLIVFFLSIYMVVDRDQIVSFLFRLVPPAYADEAHLLQTSVSRSFGGFLRGQALMGVVYFLIALATNLLLGLPLVALTSVSAGLLQAIPFFGPFLSWAPPVVVALLLQPTAALPALVIDAHRLDGRDERPPAADHAGCRGHPPDRGPGFGAGRLADRRHPGGDLRDPDRRSGVRVLLPVPPSRLGGSDRRRTCRPSRRCP